MTNITPTVSSLLEKQLHVSPDHPISIVKQKVYEYFQKNHVDQNRNPLFTTFDDLSPVTTQAQNFDYCLMPDGHKDRSEDENIFINEQTMLRCHMTAHVVDLIEKGYSRFLCSGDVYRYDMYDNTHSDLFHQTEVTSLFTADELHLREVFDKTIRMSTSDTEERQLVHTEEAVTAISSKVKEIVEDIILGELLAGEGIKYRWVDNYLPFSRPDFDMEVMFNDEWLEIASAGMLKQEIVDRAGATDKINWNFALGLDRIAMVLFKIPDIRLLSSSDERVLASLSENPGGYSSTGHPFHWKELVFWIPYDIGSYSFERKFYQFLRMVAGDSVERVMLVDNYQHPETKQVQHRYRITYRKWEKPMGKEDVDMCHDSIKKQAEKYLKIELEEL